MTQARKPLAIVKASKHAVEFVDGTCILVSGPQADKAVRLVQAAPVLLVALQELIDENAQGKIFPARIAQARRAIAKATGGSA